MDKSPFTRKFDFLAKAVETIDNSDADIYFLIPIESLITAKFNDIMGDRKFDLYLPKQRINFENDDNIKSSVAFGSVILYLSKTAKGIIKTL